MPAPDVIYQLVRRFEEHLDSYRSGRYNETQLRREFLDPFFEALGRMYSTGEGYAKAYKNFVDAESLEVKRMLELRKRAPKTPQEQAMVKREIESLDTRIDRLVYELYGLSEEEIKIVEGKE